MRFCRNCFQRFSWVATAATILGGLWPDNALLTCLYKALVGLWCAKQKSSAGDALFEIFTRAALSTSGRAKSDFLSDFMPPGGAPQRTRIVALIPSDLHLFSGQ